MKTRLKTCKTAAKRFKKSGTGKLIRSKTGLNHLMLAKSGSRRRRLTVDGEVDSGSRKRIARLLGKGL